MITIGIESSTPVCSVGVVDGSGGTWEASAVDRHVHSDRIITLIQQSLAQAGQVVAAVGCVAVSSGPGSFTGLRIGMSAAKGLCKGLNIPIVPVPTFEAVASAAFEVYGESERIMVAVDAKRDDFYITSFARMLGGCRPMTDARIIPLAELHSVLGDVRLVLADRVDVVRSHVGRGVSVVEMQQFLSGARIAGLGRARAMKGSFGDVATVEPLYLKDFIIRQPANR